MLYFYLLVTAARSMLLPAAALRLENLALRQQLAILKPRSKRPKLRARDRWFWVLLSRVWTEWSSVLLIVQPETVVRWHRQGFRRYWRWRSRKKSGRPTIDPTLIHLIKRLSRENPLWGTPRIQLELELLGHEVAGSTVDKYRVRPRRGSSGRTWMTLLSATTFCTFPREFSPSLPTDGRIQAAPHWTYVGRISAELSPGWRPR